jgi:hypothetical protein
MTTLNDHIIERHDLTDDVGWNIIRGAAGPMLQLVNAHGQTIILRLEEVIELYDNLPQMIERLEGEK